MEEQIVLSCAVITYNEEKRIDDCIKSVHEFCDEVLVLDSFSTDKTEQIARSYPRVVFGAHAFDGHVQQKNRAIEMCRGKWVLSIDADERVTPELGKSIRQFIDKNPDAAGARIKRLTYHLGRFIRHGGWYNARYRLIQKGKAAWGGENPHDQIFIDGRPNWKANLGPVLKGDLIHYSFTDLSHQIDTINKFSSIIAFTRNGQGKRFNLFNLIFSPLTRFLEMYIGKRGFLDGMAGFIIAVSSAFSVFLRYAKLYEMQRTEVERPSNVRPDYEVQQKKT